MDAIDVRILGPLEVALAGREVRLASAMQRRMLAALVLFANQVVSADRLIEALWRDAPPATAAHAVHVYVSRLRRLLGPGPDAPDLPPLLLTRAPGYLLRVGADSLDSDRFENLAAAGRAHLATGSADVAAHLLREALALWRGSPLVDLEGYDVAAREAARLEELRHAATEDRVDADLARGHHGELVGELQALVAAHPFRERMWSQLMLALYRCGRQAQALETYRTLQRRLAAELGIDPAPETRRLHTLLLRHDPQIDWRPPPTAWSTRAPGDEPPETRYVDAGGDLAYQTLGEGPVDIVFLPGYVAHLEVRWEEPGLTRLYRSMASRARLTMVDRRGTGLSDRAGGVPPPEQHVADITAVIDAVGARRVVVFGVSDGGVLALLLARALGPRVAGVVTYAAYPAFLPTDDGCGHSAEFLALLDETADQRFVLDIPLLDQIVALMAPGRTGDEAFIRWLGRYVRLSAGPGATAAAFAAIRDVDIRPLLGEIRAPTLVLHRVGDRAVPISNARHLATHIPGAQLVPLPGDDHIIWAGDVDAVAAHVVRFVAGVTGERLPDPA